ncbi:MAG: TIGR01777 family protein [Ignavibacteriae bacterium]|nr:TIGR01777 family protein [Ignavibacteriota bacterium]
MGKSIIIIGGSGFIGQKLSIHLNHSGFDIIIFSRNPEKISNQFPGSLLVNWNPQNHDSWKEYINNSFGIINLAGASIGGKRWTKNYKQEIINSRLNTTNSLVAEILKSQNPPNVLINASGVDFYGDTGNNEVDESAAFGDGFLASVCSKWEEAAFKASSKTRVVAARMGLVIAKEALAVKRMLLPFKLFIGGPLGVGNQWFPWIHIDDVVEMYKWIIENPEIRGPVNFVSPHRVTMNEFAKSLGKVLHRPSIFKVPEFLLRIAVGDSADMIVNSKSVVPKVAIEKGFKFKYTELEKALIDII